MKRGSLLALLLVFSSAAYAQNTPMGLTTAEARRAQAYYHFSMARMLDQQGDWEGSIEEYKKAMELSPNDSVIHAAMAQTYFNDRKRDEAIKAAETAIKLNPDNIGAHRLLRDVYLSRLDDFRRRVATVTTQEYEATVDKAIEEYEHIVRIDPSNRQDFIMLATLYRLDDNPEKAAEVLKRHINLDPGSETGVIQLARLYMDSGSNAEAIELLQSFLKTQATADGAMDLLGDAFSEIGDSAQAAEAYKRAFQLNGDPETRNKYADALFEDNRLDEAAKLYEEILAEDRRNGAVLSRLGQIYRQQTKYAQAREALNRALALNRNDLGIRFNLVLVDRDEGNIEDGIRSLREILDATEKTRYNPEERRSRAFFLTHLGLLQSLLLRYDEAVATFQQVRELSDAADRPRIDRLIGDTYRTAKSLDKAISHLEVAIKEAPESRDLQMAYADAVSAAGRPDDGIRMLQRMVGPEPDLELLSAMAGIYEGAKRFSEAQAIVDRALKMFPDEKDVYFLQGALHERQKKFTEAEQAFRKALELDENDPSVLNYLGYMLADRGMKLDEALMMVTKAVESDPINGAFLDSLGWVYFKMDRLDLAEQYLKRALIFAANNATMHDHLGDVYFKRGQFREAEASWVKGLQYADDPEEAAQIRQKLDQVRTRIANR
jgi:tetratricopeptide (TPR) repeat protein